MKTLTEKQEVRLHFFRDSMAVIAKSLSDQLAEVGMLLTSEEREAGFEAYARVEAARDAMMNFINVLDDVEYPKEVTKS